MRPLIRYLSKLGMLALLFPLRIFPVKKNRVVLRNCILNFSAKYGCSPKYIAEHLLKAYPNKFELVYPLGKDIDGSELTEKGIIVVRVNSLKYYYFLMTSKFFITTSGGISYIPFRKSQVVINTWHGGGAYKKMGLDASSDFFYRQDCKLTASKTSYFVSSNKIFTDIVMRSLLIGREKVLEIGLPRNDVFFTDYSQLAQKVKYKYNIGRNAHIVLYAPTYRTPNGNPFLGHELGPYEIDAETIIDAASRRFGGDWVFALRLHPSIAELGDQLSKNIINLSDYNDMQELMCAADILINDYSSTMWDFVQTRKPCFIFAKDLQEYETSLGLYTKPSTWPFPLAQTNSELIKNIEQFDTETYHHNVEEYFNWMGSFETGHACEKLCAIMAGKQ